MASSTESTTIMSAMMSQSEASVATGSSAVFDIKPSDRSVSQLNLDFSLQTVDKADSFCSLTSSVMGPPTYRPPDPTEEEGEYGVDDLDLKIKEVKCKIESQMKNQRQRPPPPRPRPPPFVDRMLPPDCALMPPPSTIPMDVDDCESPEPALDLDPHVPVSDPTVVLDPTSGTVVPIAALSWHQRYALSHPYFRNMPYVPPQMPSLPPPVRQHSFPNVRGRGQFRNAPLVRYIPGGYKDINRQSSFCPVDFSSELMNYVRMRKEMLKMDLREKIRQRKEDLLKSQKAVFEGGRGGGGGGGSREAGKSRYSYDNDRSVRPSGKYSYYRREDKESETKRSRDSSPVNKTPREVWQSRVRQRENRSSSSSSSSDDDDDNKNGIEDDAKRDSRRKWIAERKAMMLARTAAIKDKIKKEKSLSATTTTVWGNDKGKPMATSARNDKENNARKSPVVPYSYRFKNESPERNADRRSPKKRGLRESKNFRDY